MVTIPESAIQFEGDKTYVFVPAGEGYERRDVVTGISDGVTIEVKEGLAAGDKVRGPQIIKMK